MSTRNQTFNKISQEFLCSGIPPSLVWTLHALSSAIVPFKVGCPHLSVCHMKYYYTTVNYNPACFYLSLEVAESHSDMWLVVSKLPDSIVSIWGTRIIIQEIPLNTDFSSISWPTQGMMYPQRCSGQTLIFEILTFLTMTCYSQDCWVSGLCSSLSILKDWYCVFLVYPDEVRLVLSEQWTKEKVQKLSNAEYH
jgi:hypothetical protein